MTRLRAILAAAAVLVGGGLSLSVALRDAGQELGMTCPEWRGLVSQVQGAESKEWFVAVADGFNPPSAVGDRGLGDCAAGVCVAEPQGCPAPISYEYQRSGLVNGWRLFRVRGHEYFARSWRQLATDNASQVRFYRSWKEVGADCIAHFTAAQCRNLLNGAGACWKRGASQYCRNGRLYGPGLGGVNADDSPATCTPQAGDVPYPCDGPRADYGETATATDFVEGE